MEVNHTYVIRISKDKGRRKERKSKEKRKRGSDEERSEEGTQQVKGERDHLHKITHGKSYCSLELMVFPRETFQN